MRYVSIVMQFGVVVLMSNRASIEVQGVYFIIFGIVATMRPLAGMGIPLAIVREVPALISAGRLDRVWATIVVASWGCVTICSSLAVASVATAILLGVGDKIAILSAIWWVCYALSYHCAQCLAALGARELGSIFYFSAPPVALLLALAPYLILSKEPTIVGILLAANASALPIVLWSAIAMIRVLLRGNWPRGPIEASALRPMIAFGFVNTISAFALGAIYWIPTWMAGLTLGAAAASFVGLASRLSNVVMALMGAIRFVVRPQIVAAATLGNWAAIERGARLVSTLTTINALLCLGISLVIGRCLIEFIFGAQYAAAYPVLVILLLSNVAEAIGGVVDEILKMTGAARFVLFLLVAVVAGQIALSWVLHFSFDMIGLAMAQAVAVVALYYFQIARARTLRNILVMPFITPRRAIEAFRRRNEAAVVSSPDAANVDTETLGIIK